ncbi:MAG: 30S ribosomal protein S20 [Candidatus Omnitrophica bacterium]|nr:30S ribosomal protein S20 [Candidatus Omnitrophota bacterium]
MTEEVTCVRVSGLLPKKEVFFMPNIASAKKRMRSDAKKRSRNQEAISEIKTLSQKLLTLSGDRSKAQELAQRVISRYDRAVSRGIIPRGRADRRKSRIAAFLAKIKK